MWQLSKPFKRVKRTAVVCIPTTTNGVLRLDSLVEQPRSVDKAASTHVHSDEGQAHGLAAYEAHSTRSASLMTAKITLNIDDLREEDCYGIKVLHSPPSAVIDIVFIHGLRGNSYTTWLHRKSKVHWPRDLLKNDMRNARIMTFGYDADVVHFWDHAAQDSISGYANDLLGDLAGHRQGNSVRILESESSHWAHSRPLT
jgi:hypothetical protein